MPDATPLLALLGLGAAREFVPTKREPTTDLEAFASALPPAGGTDREFLALEPALGARLGIAPGAVREIAPGLACGSAARPPNALVATLGRVVNVQVVCGPDGWSQGFITLRDGSTYIATCGNGRHASASLTIGSHSLNFSTGGSVPGQELTHSCTGWTKLPR